jgi:hypothetical protein
MKYIPRTKWEKKEIKSKICSFNHKPKRPQGLMPVPLLYGATVTLIVIVWVLPDLLKTQPNVPPVLSAVSILLLLVQPLFNPLVTLVTITAYRRAVALLIRKLRDLLLLGAGIQMGAQLVNGGVALPLTSNTNPSGRVGGQVGPIPIEVVDGGGGHNYGNHQSPHRKQ